MSLTTEVADFYVKAVETVRKKNADYAGEEDPLKNFRLCEDMNFCSMEEGIFVRLLDKISRISTLLSKCNPDVADETLMDTIQDAANYLAILNTVVKMRGTL